MLMIFKEIQPSNMTNTFLKNILKLLSKDSPDILFKHLLNLFLKQNSLEECEKLLSYMHNDYDKDSYRLDLLIRQEKLKPAIQILNHYSEDWDFTHNAALIISRYYTNKNDLNNALLILKENLFSTYEELSIKEKEEYANSLQVIDFDYQLKTLFWGFISTNQINKAVDCLTAIIDKKTQYHCLTEFMNMLESNSAKRQRLT